MSNKCDKLIEYEGILSGPLTHGYIYVWQNVEYKHVLTGFPSVPNKCNLNDNKENCLP